MQLNLLLGTALVISLALLLWRELKLRRLQKRLRQMQALTMHGTESLPEQVSAPVPAAMSPAGDIPVSQPLAGLHLLVAGNRSNRQLELSLLLTRLGAVLHYTDNGQQAIQQVLHSDVIFDALLLEDEMPVMNAVQTVQELRDVLQLLDLPVFGVNFNSSPAMAAAARDAGITDFFEIPREIAKLQQALAEIPDQLSLF